MKETKTSQTFAVIETAGHQYKVAVGDVITLDQPTDQEAGSKITFDSVLLTDDGKKTVVGTPTVKGLKVEGELVDSGKQKKILVQRFRSKSRYHRRYGHRQPFTKVKIMSIK